MITAITLTCSSSSAAGPETAFSTLYSGERFGKAGQGYWFVIDDQFLAYCWRVFSCTTMKGKKEGEGKQCKFNKGWFTSLDNYT